MSTPTETKDLRGFPLLDAVILQITAHPETWEQAAYRCNTGMCVAGWAIELTGGRWVDEAAGVGLSFVQPEPDDDPLNVYTHKDMRLIHADDRARRLLGIDFDQAEELFAGDNKLPYIIDLAERFKAEAAARGGER